MNALLKSVTVVDSKSDFHNSTVDILIENGIISKISKRITNPGNIREIKLKNLHCSPGWFDSSVAFGEPGFEERETLENGIKTAALSGFTSICLNSTTRPQIDSSSSVRFILDKTRNAAVKVLPMGSLTVNSDSVDLAELYDMTSAGAIAFGDYKVPTDNANLMKIALQYASNFDGLVLSNAVDSSIKGKGVVNEEVNSTKLGLKGIASLAEELRIARDLFILEYTGGKLHIPTISTSKSVDLIREAKQKKLDVSCSVAIHNLVLTDDLLSDFNTNYKVNPPLRTSRDCEALIEGLKDGSIDMVTTDHYPLDVEHKNIEFDNATDGTIGLESAFGVLNTVFTTKKTISLLLNGKRRFNQNDSHISVGELADLSLFDPDKEFEFSDEHIFSKSKNSCFLGHKLKGKVYGIIANNQVVLKND
ncbi:dihydroorotase [Winogradskyella aurantiaca]|uniref:dihydroorotase n=1 Tax=Winogradskyella aurantiaca TaxID=2219558 RepID=UPI000E1CA0B5|nr:dihydroorotase [Winogradskyella aurantiaca]